MNVYTLWKQYPESRPGEMMPNVYDCVDEYLNDDNPDYFQSKIEEARREVQSGNIVDFRVIVLRFDDDVVTGAFGWPRVSVDAEVQP